LAARVAVGATGAGRGGGGGVTLATFLLQPANNNTPASAASKANVSILFCVTSNLLILKLHSLWTRDSVRQPLLSRAERTQSQNATLLRDQEETERFYSD